MSNLTALVWFKRKFPHSIDGEVSCAQGAGLFYRIVKKVKCVEVMWGDSIDGSHGNKEMKTIDEAKNWVETDHYPSKMQPYVKPDSIKAHFDNFTQWGLDRGIIQNGNELAQGLKLVSEMGELTDNLARGRCIKDDIGDCMVVLNMLAQMTGVTLDECLEQAWGDIKDRKGYMNENGVFIKESDCE